VGIVALPLQANADGLRGVPGQVIKGLLAVAVGHARYFRLQAGQQLHHCPGADHGGGTAPSLRYKFVGDGHYLALCGVLHVGSSLV